MLEGVGTAVALPSCDTASARREIGGKADVSMRSGGTSMESRKRMSWKSATKATTIAAVALAAVSCTTDPYYYDPYSYYYGAGYYYPTDIAYGGAYYSDYGAYGTPVTYAQSRSAQRETHALPGATLRALASGEDLCPGHVTVAKTPGNAPCQVNGREPAPATASIQFSDCTFPDGGRLDGAVQIDTTQTASDTDCDADTRIDVSFTSTATDLAYTAESGARVVLPALTLTGSYTRGVEGRPSLIEIGIEGQIDRYAKDGDTLAQTSVSGKQTLTPLESADGYRASGALTMRDPIDDETVRVTSDGVNRPDDCCYPTSGSIELERSNGDLDVLRFGPGCNDVTLDSEKITLHDCL
jgi:hypothetical protein